MHLFHLGALSSVLWLTSYLVKGSNQDERLLEISINALYKGLQFMEDHIFEINLDGALGCKLVYDILNSFLESRSDIFHELGDHLQNQLTTLRDKAGRITDESKRYLIINDPEYYANIGGLIEKSKVLMWFPSRSTQLSLQVQPYPCSNSTFNETLSDLCLQEIIPTKINKKSSCKISKKCVRLMTKPRQRGYMLTHQVLYFQVLEMNDCIGKSDVKTIPILLKDTLCSNVMRDTEEIFKSHSPLNHHDLFMEQIGLCGLWGYKDFYKPNWLKKILDWQQTSGCYANRAKWHCTENLSDQQERNKREEKILEDGCLSHKTAVAILAIAADIRFIIEKLFKANT